MAIGKRGRTRSDCGRKGGVRQVAARQGSLLHQSLTVDRIGCHEKRRFTGICQLAVQKFTGRYADDSVA